MNFKGRNFLSLQDYTSEEIKLIINKAKEFKNYRIKGDELGDPLKGRKLCMIFQKPSTRTLVSFDVAMNELGGHAIVLSSKDIQLSRGETIHDTGKTLARYCDAIMARVYDQDDLIQFAQGAGTIPIINGLSNLLHPCQIVADLMTIEEKKGTLNGLKLTYLGDGNNVANSLLLGCSKLGINITIACPKGYEPNETIVMISKYNAQTNNCNVELINSPQNAVKNADIIYTDTWVSMGKEDEKEIREKIFMPYQVNKNLIKLAKPDVIVMHCLPAHRGYEITNDVIDGPHSVVFDQAENRLHVQKAILYLLLI
ncbi:MAG: ornithine carbamoyltransferase [Candidatus Helarchaeota archaeon]